ncbi:MAG: PIN domain-containing protein [Gemmatimonadales bacterium]|nr:MAG: PIN domain-containing protein [Gemmatimonadales bacterium]
MIALDTNILVRFLTEDDEAQTALANALISSLSEKNPGFICREVMVELVWVLERAYKRDRSAIAQAVEGLLAAPEIRVEAAEDIGRAAQRYREEGLGFADVMIAKAAERAGASELVTLDRRAAGISNVRLLGS